MPPDDPAPPAPDANDDADTPSERPAAPPGEGTDTTLRRTGLSRRTYREERTLPARDEIELLHPTKGLEPYPGVFMPDIEQERTGAARYRPRARRFLVLFLVILLAQAVAVTGLNYTVNPRSEFPPDTIEPLVLNDARLKTRLLDDRPVPDVLILGSSRSITLDPSATIQDDTQAFNFAVSDGNLAEQRAILSYVIAEIGTPETVVVGLEPERMFGEQSVRARIQNSPIHAYGDDPATFGDRARTLADSYSYRYLKDTLSALRFSVTGAPEPNYVYDADGQRHYLPFEDPARRGGYDVDAAIQRTIDLLEPRLHKLADSKDLDVPELRALVDLATRHGIEVRLFLTPLHPDVWRALEDAPLEEIMQSARTQAAALCADTVSVSDLSHIEHFGGDPADFYDGWHYVQGTADRALQAALSDTADICP